MIYIKLFKLDEEKLFHLNLHKRKFSISKNFNKIQFLRQ